MNLGESWFSYSSPLQAVARVESSFYPGDVAQDELAARSAAAKQAKQEAEKWKGKFEESREEVR